MPDGELHKDQPKIKWWQRLDFGRDGPNPQWHRRWLSLLMVGVPLITAIIIIFVYGPSKGLEAAALFILSAYLKALDYTILRRKDK